MEDDEFLLDQLQQGNQRALVSLMDKYHGKIYRVALFYLKSEYKAQEITQDIFVKIWLLREKLSDVQDFPNYLFIISRNEIIDALRKKYIPIVEPEDDMFVDSNDPQTQLVFKELSATVRRGINQLPPVRRRVFMMSRYQALSYHEIATRLNISTNGVKDHVVKAIRFLRDFLSKQEGNASLIVIWILLRL